MAYLTLSELIDRSVFEEADWVEFFARPGRANTFAAWESEIREEEIDAPLRVRYATPFTVAHGCVKGWMVKLFDERLQTSRRMPGHEDATTSDITGRANIARQRIQDAADPDKPAHPELPLLANGTGSGVAKCIPIVIAYHTGFDFLDEVEEWRMP